MRRERKAKAVPVDQREVAAALIRHGAKLRLHGFHLPRRKQRGVDDAGATD